MDCIKPTSAFADPSRLTKSGKQYIDFSFDRENWSLCPDDGRIYNRDGRPVRELLLPCGKCIMCRKRRGFEIGIRARCEAVCHPASTFITLTVSDNNMQRVFPGRKLSHRPWQLFAKRLRKHIKFRFLMCGEYGERTHRPHYHSIIFGHDFVDGYFDDRGCWHGSRLIEECWPYGHITCERCNDRRIMYVAGYCLKDATPGYESYVRWSRMPGLGAAWFDRFWSSCYRHDGFDFAADCDRVVSAIIWRGKLTPFACRYFDQRLLLHDNRLYDILKAYRLAQVGSGLADAPKTEVYMESMLQGLRNRVDQYERRLAARARDLDYDDYVAYSDVDLYLHRRPQGRELKQQKQ